MSVKDNIDPLPDDEAAANLVRARIDSLFEEVEGKPSDNHGLIDRFWHRHHNHPEPHKAWSDYYSELSEDEKHHLWEEYHLKTGTMSGVPTTHDEVPQPLPEQEYIPEPPEPMPQTEMPTVSDMRKSIEKKKTRRKPVGGSLLRRFFKNHVWPVVSAALVVMFLWLVFNNELVVARVKQYISPGSTELTPVIIDPSVTVSEEPKVIIPKINVDVPVVYDITSYDENEIQAGLERGVVHYGTTALPGEAGNSVIVGHSSNNFFNSGKYKFAFVLLNRLDEGDTFILNYDGTRYVYRVFNKQIIEPTDFSLIQPTDDPIATLITCDPPGTSWRRLVIQGEQITPDPAKATEVSEQDVDPGDQTVPGNAPSLWDSIRDFIF